MDKILKEILKLKDQLDDDGSSGANSASTEKPRTPQPSQAKSQGVSSVARTITYNYPDGTSETAPLPPGVTAMVRRVGGPQQASKKGRGKAKKNGQNQSTTQSQGPADCQETADVARQHPNM